MQRERKARCEEKRNGYHMGGIVVEIAVGVAGVRNPIEMTDDPVGKSVAPRPHQHRPDHDQGEIGENRKAEGERHMIADAELATYLDFTQRPRHECAECADRHDLPDAALLQRSKGQAVFHVGRVDTDLPQVPGRTERGAPQDHRNADQCEKHRRHAEEPDIEWADPEIEQVASDQRSAANAIFPFKAEHRHRSFLRVRNRKIPLFAVDFQF